MADEADVAGERAAADEVRRRREFAVLSTQRRNPRDDCAYCHELLSAERRESWFCDADCRDDWEYEQSRRKVAGR